MVVYTTVDYDCDGVFIYVCDGDKTPTTALSSDQSAVFELEFDVFERTYLRHSDPWDVHYWRERGYFSGRFRTPETDRELALA